jgi:hypothetical protein
MAWQHVNLTTPERSPETTLTELFRDAINAAALQEAVEDCQTYQRLEDRGYVDALHARYPHLRRYLPAFYTLPFAGDLARPPCGRGSTWSCNSMRGR